MSRKGSYLGGSTIIKRPGHPEANLWADAASHKARYAAWLRHRELEREGKVKRQKPPKKAKPAKAPRGPSRHKVYKRLVANLLRKQKTDIAGPRQ